MIPNSISVHKKAVLQGHKAAVFALTGGRQVNSFYSGSGDGIIAEWNPDVDSDGVGIASINTNIFSLLNSNDESKLIAGDMFGGIHLIDADHNIETGIISSHGNPVYAFQELEAGYYAAGLGNGYVLKFTLNPFEQIQLVKICEKNIRSLEYYSEILYAASSDGSIYMLSPNSLEIINSIPAHIGAVFSMAIDATNGHLISGGMDAQVKVWNLETMIKVSSLEAHLFTVNDIKLAPSGKLLATASRDNTIRLWEAGTYKLLKSIDKMRYDGHKHSVNKLFWYADSSHLISCSDDKTVIVWQLNYNT